MEVEIQQHRRWMEVKDEQIQQHQREMEVRNTSSIHTKASCDFEFMHVGIACGDGW